MNAHKNARTTSFGRAVMIRRVLQEGSSVTAVWRLGPAGLRPLGSAGLQDARRPRRKLDTSKNLGETGVI
jgi:leucine-zipper of insertion element IS481